MRHHPIKKFWNLAFLAFLVIGTVLIVRHQRNMPYQHNEGLVFGTSYSVTYQCDQDLQAEIEKELQKVDNALSMFNEQSVISRFNRCQSSFTVDDTDEGRMFFSVVNMAQDISRDTDGAFDITVAPLVNLWGFGFESRQEPTRQAIDSIRQFVGYKQLSLSERRRPVVSKQDSRTMLDCSAIAKGFGTDVVAALLRKHDVENFMVEIGGEVVTRGVNPERVPWRIGVNKPTDDPLSTTQELQTVLNVTDRAMATSGNYRNFYYKDGKKYAHTIDPKTGHPVQHNILSATVLAKNCATADAYATAFMVVGLDGARQLLDRHPDLMAYLIYTDEHNNYAVWVSPSMKGKIADD